MEKPQELHGEELEERDKLFMTKKGEKLCGLTERQNEYECHQNKNKSFL